MTIFEQWEKFKIEKAQYNFWASGDSMQDCGLRYYDADGIEIDSELINKEKIIFDGDLYQFDNRLEDLIWQNNEFYVDGDGEFGDVFVTLEEGEFNYNKVSKYTTILYEKKYLYIDVTDEDAVFMHKYINEINGNENDIQVNYKIDFILTDEIVESLRNVQELILYSIDAFLGDFENGEDAYEFTTENNEEDISVITVKDNKLRIELSYSTSTFTDS